MLGFSFSSIAKNKKPKIKIYTLANPPQPDPSGVPVIQNIAISNVKEDSADISWNIATANGGITITTVECYKVSANANLNPYDQSLLGFNLDIPVRTGKISVNATGLQNNQSYRLRIKAVKFNNAGVEEHSSAWIEHINTFTTLEIPVGFTGFRNGAWYWGGEKLGLPASGTGVHDGYYFIEGSVTGLSYLPGLGWSGNWLGYIYIGGKLANGHYSCPMCSSDDLWFISRAPIESVYFINGMPTDYGAISSMGGTGIFDGIYYNNYYRYTGSYNDIYYLYGRETNLDNTGSGYLGGNGIPETFHLNGAPYTGWLDGENVFFIDGKVAIGLDSSGTGIVNGKYYYAGMYIGDVGNPYDAGQTSSQGSRFSQGVTYDG